MAETRIRPSDELIQENIKKWNIPQPDREYTVLIHCTTYNHGKYIKDALEGFVMQKCTYSFCAIIIDDCSTDNNQEIIKEYAAKYPDIIKPILLGENHMQRGLLRDPYFEKWHQSAKYLAQCEGDDYWIDPYKLQKQVDFMEEHSECSLVFHNAYKRKENSTGFIGKHKICNHSCFIPLYKIIRDGGLVPTLSIVQRLSDFESYSKFPQNCPAGDLKTQTYAAIVGKVYYINEIMGVYRLVDNSATHKVFNDTTKFVERHNKFINWYNEVNAYTNYKYRKEVIGAIAFSEARIAIAIKNYKRLWNPKYYAYIWNEPINSRIGLILRMMGLNSIYSKIHSILDNRRNK